MIPELNAYGVRVTIVESAGADGATVVYVDTDLEIVSEGSQGPRIRIRLNDDLVFDGTEE